MAGLLFTTLVVVASAASAAPIACPGGQTVTKVDGGWQCINNGGNGSNRENPKNPNAGKDKF
ncbi:hypothetical protein C3B78_15720 [Arthrobacter sp. PGP41]|nr:hypothetical protein C3B78_15720 [Arthrobacter sp. PGP41]